MIRERPSFFADWSRHNFVVAIKKRWGAFEVAGRRYKYDAIVKMQWGELQQLMNTAAPYRQREVVCWVFEAMSIQVKGELSRVLPGVLATISVLHDSIAVEVLKPILEKYLTNGEAIKQIPLDARSAFLIGKAYSDLAFSAKGRSKNDLQNNKKLALHHLGTARERCQHEQYQPGADPYRAAAIAAALAASVAAAYEAAAYLQWKGTRTAAMAE